MNEKVSTAKLAVTTYIKFGTLCTALLVLLSAGGDITAPWWLILAPVLWPVYLAAVVAALLFTIIGAMLALLIVLPIVIYVTICVIDLISRREDRRARNPGGAG